MGVVSLLYNLLVLGLSWGSWLGTKTRSAWEGEERSVLGVNGKGTEHSLLLLLMSVWAGIVYKFCIILAG
jgi:hypothetical protein